MCGKRLNRVESSEPPIYDMLDVIKPRLLFGLIFFLTGVFWVFTTTAVESSLYTVGVGVISIASGLLLVVSKTLGYVWSLFLAASLYNLAMFAYLVYASSVLIASGSIYQGWVSAVSYLLVAALYLFMLLSAVIKPSYLAGDIVSKDTNK